MGQYSELNKKLQPFLEDYDTWLLNQADEYMDPRVSEVEVKGVSYFDVKVKTPEGEIKILKNIPLDVMADIDVTQEDENTGKIYPVKWDYIQDRLEDYFDFNNVDYFDTYVEGLEEQCLPEDYELIEVLGFSDGHSFEDLQIQ